MTRTLRTTPAPPLTGGTSATSSPGCTDRALVGVLAVDRHHARARGEVHRGEQVGDRRAVGQLDLHAVAARALAQAREESDADHHADSLGGTMPGSQSEAGGEMTDTAVEPATTEVEEWLARFDEALTAGDSAAASELFLDDSYWRDLVAFTWNLKTVEGPAGVKDMLDHTLAHTKPRNWATTEPPASAEGVTEAWIEFETEVGRGRGHLRLKDGKAWTLLTTLDELKGHEEPSGAGRPMGAEHGANPDRETWLEQREREATRARLRDAAGGRDHRRRPGRHRARRAPAPARRADDHRRAQRAPRRLLAQALQVALPARPGLVRPPALHQVPRELAGVLAEGQDRRLARDVHEGDGAQLLELDRGQERHATTRRPASGSSSSSATARRSRCARSSS